MIRVPSFFSATEVRKDLYNLRRMEQVTEMYLHSKKPELGLCAETKATAAWMVLISH